MNSDHEEEGKRERARTVSAADVIPNKFHISLNPSHRLMLTLCSFSSSSVVIHSVYHHDVSDEDRELIVLDGNNNNKKPPALLKTRRQA